jgi:hypothetical protein
LLDIFSPSLRLALDSPPTSVGRTRFSRAGADHGEKSIDHQSYPVSRWWATTLRLKHN